MSFDCLGMSTNAGVVGSARVAWMYHEKVQEVVAKLDERIRHLYVVERKTQDDSDIQVPSFSFDLGKQPLTYIAEYEASKLQGIAQFISINQPPEIIMPEVKLQQQQAQTSPLIRKFPELSPPIFFEDPDGQNLGIQVNQDEDEEHVTIRIVKNPVPPQPDRYKVN